MTTIAQSWYRTAGGSPFFNFVDVNLRGAGQVMLQDNPGTGLLFLIGIFWSGIASRSMEVPLGCLLGLATSTLMAIILEIDQTALHEGLYGYNGILVGAALTTFLPSSPLLWIYLIFGAAISTIAMLAISNVVKTWGVSALTSPLCSQPSSSCLQHTSSQIRGSRGCRTRLFFRLPIPRVCLSRPRTFCAPHSMEFPRSFLSKIPLPG